MFRNIDDVISLNNLPLGDCAGRIYTHWTWTNGRNIHFRPDMLYIDLHVELDREVSVYLYDIPQ